MKNYFEVKIHKYSTVKIIVLFVLFIKLLIRSHEMDKIHLQSHIESLIFSGLQFLVSELCNKCNIFDLAKSVMIIYLYQ